MDYTNCKHCKCKVEIVLGTLPGEGYQVGFFNECGECGYVNWLLIDEDNFYVKFYDKDGKITFDLKGAIEKIL